MDIIDPKELNPKTLLALKLIQQPFSKLPASDRLFDYDALKQTRDTVQHHLQFSHLLLVIHGEKGAGKSSFIRSLIQAKHPSLYFFNVSAAPGDNTRAIVQKAAQSHQLQTLDDLQVEIRNILYRGQQPIIIINQAHLLEASTLKELLEYCEYMRDANQQSNLKLLLLGERGIDTTLKNEHVLNYNQYYLVELPSLNVSNTRAFLMQRLRNAGYRDEDPFDDKDITTIFTNASGNAAKTLEYAAAILNRHKNLAEENNPLPQKSRWPLIITGVILLLAVIIYNSIITGPDKSALKEATITETPVKQHNVESLPVPTINTMAVDVDRAKPQSFDSLQQPMSAEPAEDSATVGSESDAAAPQTELSLKELQVLSVPEKAQPKLETNTEQPVPAESVEQNQPAPVEAPQTKSSPEPAAPAKKPALSAPQKAAPVAKPSKPATPSAATSPYAAIYMQFRNAGIHDEDWLLEQPPSSWSLQILGAQQPETLLKFVQDNQIKHSLAFYRKKVYGKDWYVLLYGNFDTRDKARGTIPYLPDYLKNNKPWVKDLQSVQADIRTLRKQEAQ